ncbi:catalase [Kurthia sp. 3B1D]|uniref:Catalase n=1 Tax=Candidatus Kurthia intestinigallinarum TaxID=1562256 RepID=A0A433RWS1_9BACL|nr:catalase [Kurthia sp. 3B1D]RUS57725.1 catalase [Kurthia sp. 3B1D]
MEQENKKKQQLEDYTVEDRDKALTTNQGLKMSEDEFSLKVGDRGPTIMEDFHFREKMTHFDHERIPERVVHARGTAAHGYFESYGDASDITMAKFLSEKGKQTPVFVRFSTVAGSRGSADSVRDARGFATKFYTEEGNYDLVGNNIPVFFIQDAIKFPDFVHAVKPEPHNEIPQAQSAHDTFWDFVANNQEAAHMVMWHMSDRSIPRSYRMMEGFGVNTYRFVNEDGVAHFVKLHWKPVLGVHSFVWDEAQKIAGKDPDFHRRDLYDAIEQGNYPEYELAVQLIPEEQEFAFDFDILDPTKIWPEEQVPLRKLGKMTLNRNVDNFFAETEQVAFHVGHVVPGIDFSNDPLLQGRLFSYTDTQLIRLGGPNFHEIPINKPVCPFHNNQRDGYNRQTINRGQVSYHKNSLQNNTPNPVPRANGGYEHYQEKVDGRKIRARSQGFEDHFSQARLFWNSMTPIEKEHITKAFCFEVGKVQSMDVRKQVVEMVAHISHDLAKTLGEKVGVTATIETIPEETETKQSPAVSMYTNPIRFVETKKVAVIIQKGEEAKPLIEALEAAGIVVEIVSDRQGTLGDVISDHTFDTASPVLYDGLIVATKFEDALTQRKVETFIDEVYNHYKAIGYTDEDVIQVAYSKAPGVVKGLEAFIDALATDRHFDREYAIG